MSPENKILGLPLLKKKYVPKHSPDKVTQVKSREKVSGSAAYVSVKLIENANEGYKLVHVRK